MVKYSLYIISKISLKNPQNPREQVTYLNIPMPRKKRIVLI